MAENAGKLAESAWREAFRQRLRNIQGKRTHQAMGRLLGMSPDSWNKCVNRGDAFPIRLLPQLADLAEMSIEELIDGPDQMPSRKPAKRRPEARAKAS